MREKWVAHFDRAEFVEADAGGTDIIMTAIQSAAEKAGAVTQVTKKRKWQRK